VETFEGELRVWLRQRICLAVKCNWLYNNFRSISIQEFKIERTETEWGKSHGKGLYKNGLRHI
jgi:hypothetical protein